jgi:outer membrane protein assembly factor BamE
MYAKRRGRMQKEARTVGEMSRNFPMKTYRGNWTRSVLLVAAAAVLAGCSTYDSLTQRVAQRITPYRITVVQGNFVSQEAAAKMRVGMTRAEVRTTLGTPLLTDMFHADRWDYLFYFRRGSTLIVQQRNFIVHFKDDRVASWEGGDDLPSELELLADIDGDKRGKKAQAKASAAAATAASAASAASASAASAPAEAAASAPVAASASAPAEAAASAPVAASAAVAPAATADVDPNAQAAQAANRAVNQAQSSSGKSNTPPVRSGAPTPGGPGGPGGAPPQIQLHRKPQPAAPNQSEPVGPAGTESSDPSASGNQSVTSTGAGKESAGD